MSLSDVEIFTEFDSTINFKSQQKWKVQPEKVLFWSILHVSGRMVVSN